MHAYLDTVLQGELDTLRTARAGRNNTLFRVAARLYQFCATGVWDDAAITAHLTQIALAIGLTQQEITATLNSARKAAARRPARVPAVSSEQRYTLLPDDPAPPEPVALPPQAWREKAGGFVDWAARQLWRTAHPAAQAQRAYLAGRGLATQTILRADLGANPHDLVRSRRTWGLPPDATYGDRLWLPAGIVIPWFIDDQLWRITIRRPHAGPAKYVSVPGGANALYGADSLRPGHPAVLVEGCFDALALQQVAGDRCGAVASGTTGARRVRWLARLACCRPILVAFDADGAGEHAAAWWLSALGAPARRWRPIGDDPAAMLAAGMDVRAWVEAGLAPEQGQML